MVKLYRVPLRNARQRRPGLGAELHGAQDNLAARTASPAKGESRERDIEVWHARVQVWASGARPHDVRGYRHELPQAHGHLVHLHGYGGQIRRWKSQLSPSSPLVREVPIAA